MAAHLSERENFLRALNGEVPEYVPTYRMMEWLLMPSGFASGFGSDDESFVNMFGVTYVRELSANNGPLPKPGEFILDDIRKWRDVIKRPAIMDEIDWEMMAKKDLDSRDPSQLKIGSGSVTFGYFQALVSFMGFNEGLMACIEEPEEVKALMHFLLELNLEAGKKFLYYYKPDACNLGDDIAFTRAPFVSEEVFLDIFAPVWRAEVAPFKEAGLPAQHHNCGNFEPFVPHIVDMGFNSWDPAQPGCNDLPAIKEKYGRKLMLCTGLESNGFCSWPDTTEEQIRAEVRRVMDQLAPGGGFAFMGHIMGPPGDPECAKRNGWIQDEYEKNKFNYYS